MGYCREVENGEVVMVSQIEQLYNVVFLFEDNTIWFDGVKRNEGYVVADGKLGIIVHNEKYKAGIEDTTNLHEQLRELWLKAQQLGYTGIGTWSDIYGTYFIDPVIHVPCKRRATRLAHSLNELCFYDLKNKQVLHTATQEALLDR